MNMSIYRNYAGPILIAGSILLTGCASTQEKPDDENAWIKQHSLYDGDDSALFVNSEFKSKAKKGEEPLTKDDYISRGDSAWRSGDTERAIFEYLRALKLDEADKTIYLKIGMVYDAKNNDQLSENAYSEALKLDPDYIPAVERSGKMILKQRKYIEARILFERAIKLDQERIRIAAESAAQADKDIVDSDDDSVKSEADAIVGNENSNNGDRDVSDNNNGVIPEPKTFDESSPFYAYNGLGVVNDLEDNHDEALRNFEVARQIIPRSALIHNNIGYSYYLAGNLNMAEDFFKQAIGFDKQYMAAWRNLALIYVRQERYEKAVHLLSSKFGDESSAYNTVGYLCMLDKKYNSADEYFQLAIKTSPVYYKIANENLDKNRKLYSSSVYKELIHD